MHVQCQMPYIIQDMHTSLLHAIIPSFMENMFIQKNSKENLTNLNTRCTTHMYTRGGHREPNREN